MTRLRKLLTLPGPDRRLVVQATRQLATARVRARVLPFRTLQRLYGFRDGAPATGPAASMDEIEKLRWAMARAQAVIGAASCVPLALAMHALLRSRGCASQVRIGVARDNGGNFRAHAWVESGGCVVVGHIQGLDRYAPLGAPGEEVDAAMQMGANDEWS